jgi:hypothetical protein
MYASLVSLFPYCRAHIDKSSILWKDITYKPEDAEGSSKGIGGEGHCS